MLPAYTLSELRDAISKGQAVASLHGSPIHHAQLAFNDNSTNVINSEPDFTGSFVSPSRIFGAPFDPACLRDVGSYPIRMKGLSAIGIPGGRIIGTCGVISADNTLFCADEILPENLVNSLQYNLNNHFGFALTQQADTTTISYLGWPEPRHHAQRVAFIHNFEPGNYGSFLIRQIRQLFYLSKLGIVFDAYVVPERTAWLLEAIELCRLPRRPIYSVSSISGDIFKEVVFINGLDTEGFMDPFSRSFLTEFGKRFSRDDQPRKIFISRKMNYLSRPDYRVLRNEDDLIRRFENLGYSEVFPENLCLAKQISLFSSAQRIAGPSGSGMLNAIFCCEERARIVDFESFTFCVRQHAKAYSSSGLDYAFCFGSIDDVPGAPIFRSWRVEDVDLAEAIEWIEAPAG